jgi:hypothetical protein
MLQPWVRGGKGRRVYICALLQLTRFPLRGVAGTALFEQVDHALQIGIASAEAPCKPVSTTLGNCLTIGDHLKLTSCARCNHGCNAETLLYEGRETRDLGFVVLSGRAGDYLNLHSVLQSTRGIFGWIPLLSWHGFVDELRQVGLHLL